VIFTAEASNIISIAMPRIGAGLGGLEWSEVKSSLVHFASKSPVHLLVCEEYIAGKAIN